MEGSLTKGVTRHCKPVHQSLSPKTVQFSPPIFGQFCEKIIFFFSPKYLRLAVLKKYFVKKKIVCVLRKAIIFDIFT